MKILKDHASDISKLCEIYKVKSLYAFGSVLNDEYTNKSDIDLIVDFYPLDV